MHTIKTETNFTDESRATAEFLAQLVQFWYKKFPETAIPRTRAAWMESVDLLMRQDDTADNLSTARDLHETLAMVADFEIRLIADDVIEVEFVAPLVLTMTAAPMAEGDQPELH